METHINIVGVLLMILALIHVFFPRYFNWKTELKSLSLINQQLIKIHTFFIAFFVFLMGLLCITSATAFVETKLGRTISIGLSIFWTTRLLFQFFGYSSKLWKGKTFETIIHVLAICFWAYLSSIFLLAALELDLEFI